MSQKLLQSEDSLESKRIWTSLFLFKSRCTSYVFLYGTAEFNRYSSLLKKNCTALCGRGRVLSKPELRWHLMAASWALSLPISLLALPAQTSGDVIFHIVPGLIRSLHSPPPHFSCFCQPKSLGICISCRLQLARKEFLFVLLGFFLSSLVFGPCYLKQGLLIAYILCSINRIFWILATGLISV